EDGVYEPFMEIPPDDATTTGVVGFVRDGSALLLLSSVGGNAARLERHDFTTSERTVVAADDRYDIFDVWPHPLTLEPQVVEFREDRQRLVVLDEDLAGDIERIRALGEGEIAVVRHERADRLWLVYLRPSDGPVHYWIYDRATDQARYLFPDRQA